jgi:hypothetical protein
MEDILAISAAWNLSRSSTTEMLGPSDTAEVSPCTQWIVTISVVDPPHFDADPDSTYHPDADPDSAITLMRIRILIFFFYADPDPTFHPYADPDPDPGFKKRLKPLKKC